MIEWVLLGVAIMLLLFVAKTTIVYRSLYLQERSSKTSFVVKHGKTMEHLIPWMKHFPGDPRKFRFIGDPIDGVLFGDDEVTFMEFKSGNSRLNDFQQRIKSLIREGKVRWKEIRV